MDVSALRSLTSLSTSTHAVNFSASSSNTSQRARSERAIDPYGVVHHRGRWYVVGWCHLRDDVRMFRLDRVLALEPRDQMFSKPLDFNCADYVLESLATIQWGWPIEVLLELSLTDARRRIAPDMGTLPETRGGVLLRTQADALDFMARFLVQIDCPFRILHPPELRDAVRQLARQLNRYARRSALGVRGRRVKSAPASVQRRRALSASLASV